MRHADAPSYATVRPTGGATTYVGVRAVPYAPLGRTRAGGLLRPGADLPYVSVKRSLLMPCPYRIRIRGAMHMGMPCMGMP